MNKTFILYAKTINCVYIEFYTCMIQGMFTSAAFLLRLSISKCLKILTSNTILAAHKYANVR